MRKITKKEAREYMKRWQLVNQVLDEELRHAPVEIKFQKMDTAYRMAVELGLPQQIKVEKRKTENEVRRRWLQLRAAIP